MLFPTGISSAIGLHPPTPGHRAVLKFDTPCRVLTESPFSLTRKAENMGRGSNAHWKGTRYVQGIGIQLTPLAHQIGNAHEQTDATDPMLSTDDGGDLQMAAGMAGEYGYRSPETDQPGSTTGGSVAANSMLMYAKGVDAADNYDNAAYRLDADQTAFPGPTVLTDTLVMDRVAVGQNPHNEKALTFTLETGGPGAKASAKLSERFFSGPASETQGFTGYGNYCLDLMGDGQLQLWEKGKFAGERIGWRSCLIGRWCEPNRAFGTTVTIDVNIHRYSRPINGKSGAIVVTCAESGSAPAATGIFMAVGATSLPQTLTLKYFVPMRQATPPPTMPQPVRWSDRRDLAPRSHASTPRYPATGYVDDDPFGFGSMIGVVPGVVLVYVSWSGDVPSGTSVEVDLMDAGGDPDSPSFYTPVSSGTIAGVGGWRAYDPADLALYGVESGSQTGAFQVRTTLNGTASSTPTVYAEGITKRGITTVTTPGEWEAQLKLLEWSAPGAAADPTTESASFRIEDETVSLPLLRNRSTIAYSLEYEYPGVDWTDPSNAWKRSILSRGYTTSIVQTQKGSDHPTVDANGDPYVDPRHDYPSPDWRGFQIEAAGEWQRAKSVLAPYLHDFSVSWENSTDTPTGDPEKATTALKRIAGWLGFTDRQIDIPDLPIRLWAGSEGFIVTPGQDILELGNRIARDYLLGWLYYDWNSATPDMGGDPANWDVMIRFGQPPSTITNLAYFDKRPMASALTGLIFGGHALNDFVPGVGPSGETMVGAPIYKLWREERIPPEFNKLVVQGTAPGETGQNSHGQATIRQTVYNFRSYNFHPGVPTADITSPDWLPYPKEAKIIDPTISTGRAIGFIAHHAMNYAGTGRIRRAWVAPMVSVTDPNDPFQKRPRRLRYYDPVMLLGEQYFIRSCTPYSRKDGVILARYEAEKQVVPI
ncbi:hypothetical protein [Fimbriimonas ginsengisoli]|uniref:Uncharacterized protein n=1 Tax=Fimbriimonas ginsengisoli Gsoil 348 TaxID=661478 RepID=A0A068NIZ0_FIMGI|nr:hypothetical protein [Fimbriimonas ginsengisoli]AIE83538.1 hypothetical protein OP10G_0170 [Fimbriimonas ginsengisoli Gsoil 348]